MLASGGAFYSLILFLAAGIFAGILTTILYLIVKLTRYNFFVVFIVDFLSVLFSSLIFYVICLKYYYASIKLYFAVCFLIGIIFQKIFIENLIAKPVKNIYNKIIKLTKQRKDIG